MTGKEQREGGRPPTFVDFMQHFFVKKRPHTIVEIGSDWGLNNAVMFRQMCMDYKIVSLPEDIPFMAGNLSRLGSDNVELIGGNAAELSRVVPQADVIFMHNVLLDLTGHDTQRMMDDRRGIDPATEAERERLRDNFQTVRRLAFKEFLKVAKPGHIIHFARKLPNESFMDFLIGELHLRREQIERLDLEYPGSPEEWEAYVIDNTGDN